MDESGNILALRQVPIHTMMHSVVSPVYEKEPEAVDLPPADVSLPMDADEKSLTIDEQPKSI